jgi:very-short-patch-repair endonuclease
MIAKSTNNYAYNKRLQPNANALRKNMTKAEACLWKYVLKARGLKGYPFRRQRPILHYIADFMCKELMLVIEVDGITHQFEETQYKDFIKQKALEEVGFTVLRFTDNEVLTDIGSVIERLERWIEEKVSPPC